ncbi:flagellar biosynthesis protein FlhG [Variovorax sp. OV329]|uniref:MinD/ParA family ATP-binding protein n=1 Tax=Variovorax sp. OV329 TaxID=1882825 RepID=UPI0008EFEA16|nr:flagellar biosynthesis protein FlhG [Variovorax sp. OV329]SFM65045.1 flagellar biosynthesis protein FlhG [Variovorax sp. OV329]
MSKIVSDQADGLRRLLARAPVRVMAVAGLLRGMGVTSVVMNLAAALAQQGRQVLLLDEHHPAPESICSLWNIAPAASLADVMAQRMGVEDAMARAPCGVGVLPALEPVSALDPARLQPHQVVLIDARLDPAGNLSPLARLAGELVLVLRADPTAITATYAGIKRLHYAHALKQLRFVLNGIGDVQDAQRIGQNMAQTGSRYLGVSLESAGWVRSDAGLAAARLQRQTVVEAFPASPSAEDLRHIAVEMGQWPWRPAEGPQPRPQRPVAPQSAMNPSSLSAALA